MGVAQTSRVAAEHLAEHLGEGAARSERFILRAFTFGRVAVLVQATIATAAAWHRYPHRVAMGGLLTAAFLESSVLLVLAQRTTPHGRPILIEHPVLIGTDVAFSAVGLVAGVWLLTGSSLCSWDNFMYPYTFIATTLTGVLVGRFRVMAGIATLLATIYIVAMVERLGLHSGLVWNVLENSASYPVFGLIAWALARELRRLGHSLDQASRQAVAREVEVARERERAGHAQQVHGLRLLAVGAALQRERARLRHFRNLHDRVLQTLEQLSRGGLVHEPGVRAHVDREAAWLRQLIEHELPSGPCDLAAALGEVVEAQAAAGLRVALNTAELLPDQPLSPELIEALAAAAGEALTNVRKHAGVTQAVLRAASEDDAIVVSVLDQGRGFDPARASGGRGIPQSLIARVGQVGGAVWVDSVPGAGTSVELRAPAGAISRTKGG
ncbi:MAG TPA: ATP-binding protein [Actinomycetota bacterium]